MDIPDKFYYWIGASIVTSFTTICALIWLGLTMSWKLSERFKSIEKDHESTDKKSDLAHKRIDKIENKIWS